MCTHEINMTSVSLPFLCCAYKRLVSLAKKLNSDLDVSCLMSVEVQNNAVHRFKQDTGCGHTYKVK